MTKASGVDDNVDHTCQGLWSRSMSRSGTTSRQCDDEDSRLTQPDDMHRGVTYSDEYVLLAAIN